MTAPSPPPGHFIRDEIAKDLADAPTRLVTRFPPEPNGFLHIGHAKAICLNFGLAQQFPDAKCNLRFDETNPAKEQLDYVHGIIDDIRWPG